MSDQEASKPLEALLSRDMAIAESRELIEKWSSYLEDLVNYATNLYMRCEKSLGNKTGTPLSLFMLFYFTIQAADGIQVLISRCCFDAAIPLVRSLWEGTLQMEWMLKSDFERRSAAYLALFYQGIYDFNESIDPNTDRGKHLRAKRKMQFPQVDLPLLDEPPKGLLEQQNQILKILGKAKFKAILDDLREDPREPRKWYSVDGGPMNLEQLAGKLRRPLEYELTYRHFSDLAHGTDVGRALAAHDGQLYHNHIRSVDHYEMVCLTTSQRLIQAIKWVANRYRPEEDTDQKINGIVRNHRPEAVND